MGIFQRTKEIVSANLNDFVDQFEEPDRMLRQALREMETLVATTSSAVARSLAAERLLTNSRDQQRREIDSWHKRAKSAIDAGDEALARRAIARQLDHQRSLERIDNQLAEARETNATLRRQLQLLRDKYAAAQERHAALAAGRAAADARRQVSASTTSALGSARAVARFEHFCRKLELAEAEAAAIVELDTLDEDPLEQELAEREMEAAIEEEFARLKQ